MIKIINKDITALDCADKTLLVSSGTISGVFLCSVTTVIDALVEIAVTSFIPVFLISNEIIKMFLKTI